MIVYSATNIRDGKRYIGATTRTLSHAKARHHQRVKNPDQYKWVNTRFYTAAREEGFNAFEWEILYKGTSQDDILEKEREFIELYESIDPAKGYNMTPGGWGKGKKLSEDQKEFLRERFAGEGNPCYGKFGSDHPAWKPELH